MSDSRPEAAYAEVLVDTCLDVQPGWEVLVFGSPEGRPLLDAIGRLLARREAFAIFQVSTSGSVGGIAASWLASASPDLASRPSRLLSHLFENCDAVIDVYAPENTRDIAAVDSALIRSARGAYMPAFQRIMTHGVSWVSCQFPTPALAQDAGLPTAEFADLLFGACLLDWNEQRSRMERHAELFDAAESVRITGDRTDLHLSIAGRGVKIDAGGANMPGGEFFCSPLEDSADGEIFFAEFPCVYDGRELSGVRLRFDDGRVVDAAAESGEEFLLEILDTDAGARRIGELGVGCNPGITRYMKNILFDEKIDGTIHIALGHGFPDLGGTNELLRPLGSRQRPAQRRSNHTRRPRRARERPLARVAAAGGGLVEQGSVVVNVSPDWPLETSRLTLRPFVADDFEALCAMRSDPEVMRYLYGERMSPAETGAFLTRKMAATSWASEGDWLTAAVVERASDLTVGDVALRWVSERDATAEIGFVFDPRHQGKGFATEAARALVDWAFATADFHRVIGRTEARNTASARVLQKLGMRLEAHLVENEWVKDEWQSELIYAVLDREWSGVED